MASASSSSLASSTSLEARLSALEEQVGAIATVQSNTTLNSRLEGLQSSSTTLVSSSHRDLWKESLKLLEELDPGMALTHQQQPLLYRRQQVLASAPSLQKDFSELQKIQHALGNKSKGDIGQAPILVEYPTLDQARLERLQWKLSDLTQRTQAIMLEMDQMLEIYHQCMTAASEKCVMADEVISQVEQKSF